VLGAGFDAAVNARANAMSWPHGTARYVVATLATLRRFRPIDYRLTVDGEVRDVRAMVVAVGNARSYGGGMQIVPTRRWTTGCSTSASWASRRPEVPLELPKVFSGRTARTATSRC
jgi:diacylglycerol kinase (ATP)